MRPVKKIEGKELNELGLCPVECQDVIKALKARSSAQSNSNWGRTLMVPFRPFIDEELLREVTLMFKDTFNPRFDQLWGDYG